MTESRFSHYSIVEKIGAGGMGEVYRAHDSQLGRDVALKILPDAFAADPERLARFEREARLLASLNHPNIGSIYGLAQEGERRALVLELVEGDDLSGRLAGGRLPIDTALAFALQVAEALEAAHGQGVIHRDLKPANIKVDRDGRVKVLDFGLAKAMASDEEHADANISHSPTVMSAGTMHGVILGTAAYMSPEQARGAQVDARADVWAFGCVLYEMLTGWQPFAGDTVSDTLASVLKTDPDWTRLPADTPLGVRRVLRRCLEKDPRRRLHDIADARIEIAEAVESPQGIREPGAADPGAPEVARRRRAPILPWGVAAILAVVAGVLAVRGFRGGEAAYPDRVIRTLITPEEGSSFAGRVYASEAIHALSPDGTRIVFIADNQLWVRRLDTINATLLRGTESGLFPFWSPDSRRIGFFGEGKLRTIPAEGGPIDIVCAAPDGRGGTWNRDNVIVFAPALRTGLYRVDASGGEPVATTTVEHPRFSTHRFPRFLPDGDHLLYVAANHANPIARTTVFVTSLSTGETRSLVQSDCDAVYASGYLITLREDNLMAYPFNPNTLEITGEPVRLAKNVSNHGGSWVGVFDARDELLTYQGNADPIASSLVWFDRKGNPQGSVGEGGLYWDFSLSPDGSKLAIAKGRPEPSLWIRDLGRGVEQRLRVEGSFTRAPVWSPDGSRIVYASMTEGDHLNVYEVAADGSSPPKGLVTGDVDAIPTSWSRDGRYLLLDYGDPGSTEIWVLDMDGDHDPEPFVQTRPWVQMGAFSPDGRWVTYTSRENSVDNVFVTGFPNHGGKWQISSQSGGSPEWSPSGDELLYEGSDGLYVARVSIRDGVFSIGDSTHKLFAPRTDSPVFIQSERKAAFAPDGRLLLKVASDEPSDVIALTLVVGWTHELAAGR